MAGFSASSYVLALGAAKKYVDSMVHRGILVGQVTNGGSFPTTRPDGSPLQDEDYVKPLASSYFPFAIGGVTFDNRFSLGIYFSGTWVSDPGTIQDTYETPLRSPAGEGIRGFEVNQAQLNASIKLMKLDKSQATVSLEHAYVHNPDGTEGIMMISAANTDPSSIVRRDSDSQIKVPLVPLNNDDAASKLFVDNLAFSRVIKTSSPNQVYGTDNSGTQITLSYSRSASSNSIPLRDNAGRTYVGTPTAGGHAANKDYVDALTGLDGVTVERNGSDLIQIKDLGVSTVKLDDSAVTTVKVADSAVTTVKIDNAAVTTAKLADDSVTTAKILDSQITLPKFATQPTTEEGKVYAIEIDGSTTLTYANNLLNYDHVTIENNPTDGLYVKDSAITTAKLHDGSVSLVKFETQAATEAGKLYRIAADGTTELKSAADSIDYDNTTIEYDVIDGLRVKDNGITTTKIANAQVTLQKLATQSTTDSEKVYTIAADGTTELTQIKNYKQVSSFVGVTGDTCTMYFLDTPDATHAVGLYVWDAVNSFTMVANTGGSSSSTFIGLVSPGSSFPTVRPDGTPLVLGDYVKPNPSSTFPFTIGTVTFTNVRDLAVFMGSTNWVLNANPYQKTSEVLVNNSLIESIGGSALYQNAINSENRLAILNRIEKKDVSTVTPSYANFGTIYCQSVTNASYTAGHLYVCTQDGILYVWKDVYGGLDEEDIPIRQNSTSYAVDARVLYKGKYTWAMVCETAGTSAATAPAWPSTIVSGTTTLTDGTVVWKLYDMTKGGGGDIKVKSEDIIAGSTSVTIVIPNQTTFINAQAFLNGDVVITDVDVVLPTASTNGSITFSIGETLPYNISCSVFYATAGSGLVELTETIPPGSTTKSITVPTAAKVISTYVLDGTEEVLTTININYPTTAYAGSVTFTLAEAYVNPLTCKVCYKP